MRVLILQDDFPPKALGGAGKVAFDFAKGLKEAGYDVFVITAVSDKSKEDKINYHGVDVFRIYSKYHQRWRAYFSLYNPRVIKKVKKIIREIKPDIIHAHNIHYHLSYHSLKIAKKYSKAVFLTFHDNMSYHHGKLVEFINPKDLLIPKNFDYKISVWQQIKRFKKRYNPLRNIIIKYYLRNISQFFAVSSALKDTLVQNNIKKDIKIIYNGINTDDWQMQEEEIKKFKNRYNLGDKKVVFFGGKLEYYKGGEQVLKAMRVVKDTIPNVVLLIAGKESDYSYQMKRMAKDWGVPMIITGWLKKEDIKTAYYASDLAVVPSICFDSFPTVNLEVMACKKPVIGTCFGGTPEIVEDNKTGYIINPYNTRLFADKIIDLLQNPQKANQFGQAGYQRVRKYFSLNSQVEKIVEYYRRYL